MKIRIRKLLWPDTCPFCGKVNQKGVCLACAEKLEGLLVREPRCLKCGKPVRYKEQEYCYDCAHSCHDYDRGAALWLHREPVSTSVYRFKYHNQRFYAQAYAAQIAAQYGALIRKWNPQVIIPVPLHKRRRRKRGYNQAELLAEEAGRILKIPVAKGLVERIRYTVPQKKLDSKKRKQNLKRAFVVRASSIRLRSVLIMDDIYTTGATIDSLARVLKAAGVQKVYFLTISIGQGY